jgi:hypothetical protein
MTGWTALIDLYPEDHVEAQACAEKMVRDARRWGGQDRFGEDSVRSHFWGALGELAFARYLGIPWDCHSGDGAKADVAGYEVRSIAPGAKYLYVKAKGNDRPGLRIVAVAHVVGGSALRERGALSASLILGWTTVDEVRGRGSLEDWGNRGAPAYMLRDLSGLRTTFPERSL